MYRTIDIVMRTLLATIGFELVMLGVVSLTSDAVSPIIAASSIAAGVTVLVFWRWRRLKRLLPKPRVITRDDVVSLSAADWAELMRPASELPGFMKDDLIHQEKTNVTTAKLLAAETMRIKQPNPYLLWCKNNTATGVIIASFILMFGGLAGWSIPTVPAPARQTVVAYELR